MSINGNIVPCKIILDNNVSICVQLNSWHFWNNKHEFAKNTNQIDDGSEFICDRSSGPSDYHAEWRRYESGKYKLLITSYDCRESSKIDVIKEVDSIGEVMTYCAMNIHPV